MNKFRDEEKDMILSIDSLKNALVVLEKTLGLTQASKQSFLQAKSFTTVRAHVRDAMSKRKADDILAEILAPSDRDVLQAFLQGKLKAGSPQGGEIMGVLKQIKEKTALLGKTKVQLAEAKEDLEDTTGAMEADQSFLVDLKERCSVSDKEWEQRSKTRSLEIAAV